MAQIDDLKNSADRLASTAKDSVEKLSAAAKETAEIGVQVLRDQIHGLVKEPTIVAKLKEVEEAFDRQVAEATRQIEDGARQLMSFWGNVLKQPLQSQERQQPTNVEAEIETESKADSSK